MAGEGKVAVRMRRKVLVSATLSAEGEVRARGEVVAVRIPERMMSGGV